MSIPPIPITPDTPSTVASSHDRILAAAKRLFASQGYEATSTMAIARLAGTSESQMMKHFGSKEGLLEAILDQGWQSVSASLKAVSAMPPSAKKLMATLEIVLNALNDDADWKELLLLEGRRVRREGRVVVLSSGYLKFVGMIDQVLRGMAAANMLRPDIAPDAIRSGTMAVIEGLMRDQVMARRIDFPANYTTEDCLKLYSRFLAAVTVPPGRGKALAAKAKALARRKRVRP